MNNKELLAQLNNLQQVKPESAWLNSNRTLLANQLYSGVAETPAMNWAVKFNLIGRMIFQPQYVAVMIVLFFVASGAIGYEVSKPAKPGDSLYIAKRISERAQFMLAFSDTDKTKLNMEFAGKRVQEMKDIIADKNQAPAETQKIADLKASAKAEIQVAKDRLAKYSPTVAVVKPVIKPIVKTVKNADNQQFTVAEAKKDNTRLDISLPDLPDQASGTIRSAQTIIEEAERSLDKNNLDEAGKKLDEANSLIK